MKSPYPPSTFSKYEDHSGLKGFGAFASSTHFTGSPARDDGLFGTNRLELNPVGERKETPKRSRVVVRKKALPELQADALFDVRGGDSQGQLRGVVEPVKFATRDGVSQREVERRLGQRF